MAISQTVRKAILKIIREGHERVNKSRSTAKSVVW